MLSIDIYLNETTRRADLVLPPTSSLHHDHYDVLFNALAVRNTARFNAAIWPRPEDERYDWEIFNEVCSRLAARVGREYRVMPSTSDVIASMAKELEELRAAEHGVDLGALRPSLYERLETEDGKIDCAPGVLIGDVARFACAQSGGKPPHSIIGRRHLRSNNSWMHGAHRRDQLMMHPDDVAALG
jgi:anaerobic selenocysteine-containing dehydrogenase